MLSIAIHCYPMRGNAIASESMAVASPRRDEKREETRREEKRRAQVEFQWLGERKDKEGHKAISQRVKRRTRQTRQEKQENNTKKRKRWNKRERDERKTERQERGVSLLRQSSRGDRRTWTTARQVARQSVRWTFFSIRSPSPTSTISHLPSTIYLQPSTTNWP